MREFVKWIFWPLIYNLDNFRIRFNESMLQWREHRQIRKEFREDSHYGSRLSWKERIYDRLFYLLDYDPTHYESGVVNPSAMRALFVCFCRAFLTRWIEILGIVMVIVVGLVCYYGVVYH